MTGFFTMTIVWSWSFWAILLVNGDSPWATYNIALFYLGLVGPTVAGVFFTTRNAGIEGLRRLSRRLFDPRPVKLKWLIVSILLVPATHATAALILARFNSYPHAIELAWLDIYLSRPLSLLTYAGTIFLFGPMASEVGWRGYALERLQSHHSPIVASIILGVFIIAWHTPLFFTVAHKNMLGLPVEPLYFCIDIMLSTFLITWIFNHSNHSLITPIIFIFMSRLSAGMYIVNDMGNAVIFSIQIMILAGMILAGGMNRKSPQAAF